MNNVLAIAHKELRSYFASPIAYIVIGFFALLFGWFYIGILDWFVRQGLQGQMGMGASSMNVNQQMIRPLILNITVVFLFLLPLITMRTYAEEKRSGHDRAAAHVAAHRSGDRARQVPRRAGALRRRWWR